MNKLIATKLFYVSHKSMVIIQLDVETAKSHLEDFYLKTTEAYVYLLDRHLVEKHRQVINRLNMDHLLTLQTYFYKQNPSTRHYCVHHCVKLPSLICLDIVSYIDPVSLGSICSRMFFSPLLLQGLNKVQLGNQTSIQTPLTDH